MLLATPFRPTNVQKYLLRIPRTELILYEKESLRWVMEPNVVTIGAQYSATDYTPDLAPPADIYRLICVTVFEWIGSMFTFTLFGINDSNCSFVTLARIYMLFWLFKTVLHCGKVERELCNFFSWKEPPTIIIFNVTFIIYMPAAVIFSQHMFSGILKYMNSSNLQRSVD